MTTPTKLITVPAAASRIGCSRSHIYSLINAGKLRRFNIALRGSKVRVAEEDVERFISSIEAPIGGAA